MKQAEELRREQEYTAQVQQLLLAVIQQYKGYAEFHDENIRMMLADAWEELRMKPTALSTQEMEQLSGEVDRILARRAFSGDLVRHYEQMLREPFFGRIDFVEEGQQPEKIVIGLYSLKNEKGELMVHDWRAPVCSLYYDAVPGQVQYTSPSGPICGHLTLKRQYRMENGRLKYYVDTDVSIDDEMLLDILSRATSTHMRSIVSTIQKEQNTAIRHESARALSVVGGAGSGKTSVAMHRAAYLMYQQRNVLGANHIAVISPGSAFTEYISTVLRDLGEENARTFTAWEVMREIIGKSCETPLQQTERLLSGDALRKDSVRMKSGVAFREMLDRFCDHFSRKGPEFDTIEMSGQVLADRDEMEDMYRREFAFLNPSLRLIRLKTVLESRMERWEESLRRQYEDRLIKDYRGRDLDMAVRLAVSQKLQPVRARIRGMVDVNPLVLYARAMEKLSETLGRAARENAQAGLIWWEDAPGIAYLMLKLGFAQPDKQILHIIIDEAQDYSETALSAWNLRYPRAHATLLGDVNQRTTPGMPECVPERWGECFGLSDAPIIRLTRCYRSTLPITRMCNALLPLDMKSREFGREGEFPQILPLSEEALKQTLSRWQREENMRTFAVITRDQKKAEALSKMLTDSLLLTGETDDMLPDAGGVVVGGYHTMKGLEFDAVIVVWPDCEVTPDEQRRLYTACSRALHGLCLLAEEPLIQKLGIVL